MEAITTDDQIEVVDLQLKTLDEAVSMVISEWKNPYFIASGAANFFRELGRLEVDLMTLLESHNGFDHWEYQKRVSKLEDLSKKFVKFLEENIHVEK